VVLSAMRGGEIFVPKMAAYRLKDLVRALLPKAYMKVEGPRAADKMHELALSTEEARHSFVFQHFYVICPLSESYLHWSDECEKLPQDFVYSSEDPDLLLSPEELSHLVKSIN